MRKDIGQLCQIPGYLSPVFYEKIIERNLCINGQKVLDIETGTAVLPRNMYQCGVKWTGSIGISDLLKTGRCSVTAG